MTTSTDPPHLLSLEEVARYLRVPPETVKGWRRTRKGPRALKIGKHLRYLPDEVKAWAQEQAEDRGPMQPASPVAARDTAVEQSSGARDARSTVTRSRRSRADAR